MKDLPEHQKVISFTKNEISNSRNTGSGHVVFLMISGSHLYGFNSPDSDVDYRGAYISETNHILGLRQPADVWRKEDPVMDIELFEMRKFLSMALSMNCNVLEHLFAKDTLIYNTSWFIDMRKIFDSILCKKGLFDSYKGMALFNYKKFINRNGLGSNEVSVPGSKPTIKKYLYVLRGLMAGTYALRNYEIQPDIMEVNRKTLNSDLVTKLVTDKQEGAEKMEANYNAFTIRELDKLINNQYQDMMKAYEECKLSERPSDEDVDIVDRFLKKLRREMLQV